MRKPGDTTRGLFEYRGQWIATEAGRKGYYRFWYDDGSRRVKRKALIATDLESAKEELIDLLAGVVLTPQHPTQVSVLDVMAHYFQHHATPKGYKPMAAARRASELIVKAMSVQSDRPMVSELTRINQRRAWRYLAEAEGLTAKSIMTYMISVRAAVNYASQPQIIQLDGRDYETQLLEHPVTIFCNQEEIAQEIGGNVSQPRQYIPTFEDLGRWIDALPEEDDFRYVIIALNTAARNEAIFDLTVSKQVDFIHGTIDLNPTGRRQTKKRRPVIRLTDTLAGWLKVWEDKPVRQYQDTVEKRINAVGKAIGMPDMTCYVLRHFIATNMRRATVEVSKEQRSKWLGHTVNEGSKTTDWYEKFDPDYLEAPMLATDEIVRKLQECTRRSLFAPAALPQKVVKLFS